MREPIRCLELFAGIGGFSAAIVQMHPQAQICCAIDLSQHALAVYQHNWDHPGWQINLEHRAAEDFLKFDANLWWMSPPCQPYTTRGKQRDIEDRRARSLLHIIDLLPELLPARLGMENVAGFEDSRARELLLEALEACGYHLQERLLCPTELGVPNRRPRYYLVAALEPLREPSLPTETRQLADYLLQDPQPDELYLSDEDLERYGQGLPILDPIAAPRAVANCFTGAYGRTFRASGAYLREPDGRVRRFAPPEIAALLGLPETFGFPDETPLRHRFKLLGNSLSIPAVRAMLSYLP